MNKRISKQFDNLSCTVSFLNSLEFRSRPLDLDPICSLSRIAIIDELNVSPPVGEYVRPESYLESVLSKPAPRKAIPLHFFDKMLQKFNGFVGTFALSLRRTGVRLSRELGSASPLKLFQHFIPLALSLRRTGVRLSREFRSVAPLKLFQHLVPQKFLGVVGDFALSIRSTVVGLNNRFKNEFRSLAPLKLFQQLIRHSGSFRILIALMFTLLVLPACGVEAQKPPQTAQNLGRGAENQQGYFNGDKARENQKDNEQKQGSLWVDSYSARLYENIHRASRVGDSVTIIVAEKSSGKDSANTNTSKKNDQTNTIGGLGGLFTKIASLASIFNPTNLISAKTYSKFEGKGTTEQKGELYAKVTATVTEVLNNGNFVIRGDKHIRVNKDDQVIVVEGVVRPYDIQADNTIDSNAIADARVTYSGFGVVAERQKPGWLTRALDYVWPF